MTKFTNASVAAPSHAKSSKKRSKTTAKALRSGRPPLLSTALLPPSSVPNATIKDRTSINPPAPSKAAKKSSKATKALINAHHNLHKSRAKAAAEGKSELVGQIDEQIAQLGGLQAYQQASLTGQSADRGGDSSVVLVNWLEELVKAQPAPSSTSLAVSHAPTNSNTNGSNPRLRVLEVGALSSRNAISRAAARAHNPLIESVRRIDLNSQEPNLIEEIDFMHLPIPATGETKYDVLSLSLVLNYVPSASGRGEMLKRTRQFLQPASLDTTATMTPTTPPPTHCHPSVSKAEPLGQSASSRQGLSCLFIVLPLPCLQNSRYLDEHRFRELMAILGYESVKSHQSAKLHYELFHWNGMADPTKENFKKLEINPGKGRNNFCITLERT